MTTQTNFTIENILDREGDLSVFAGGWKSIAVRELAQRESADVGAVEAEVFLFILDGKGCLRLEDGDVEVSEGTAVSLAFGTRAMLQAAAAGLRVFEARVSVEA